MNVFSNKKGLRLTHYIVGILIGSLVIAGMVEWVGGLQQGYNVTTPLNTSFNRTFNKINEMMNLTQQVNQEVNGSSIQTGGIIDLFTSLSKGVFTSAKLVLNSYGVVTSMITEMYLPLHIPKYVIDVILAIILIGLLGYFLFAIFKVPS